MWKVSVLSWAARTGPVTRILYSSNFNGGVEQYYYNNNNNNQRIILSQYQQQQQQQQNEQQIEQLQQLQKILEEQPDSLSPVLPWGWSGPDTSTTRHNDLVPFPDKNRSTLPLLSALAHLGPETRGHDEGGSPRFWFNSDALFDAVNLGVILAAGLHMYRELGHPPQQDPREVIPVPSPLRGLLRTGVFRQSRFILGGTEEGNEVSVSRDGPGSMIEGDKLARAKDEGVVVSDGNPVRDSDPPQSAEGDKSENRTLQKAVQDFSEANDKALSIFHNLYGLQALKSPGGEETAAAYFAAGSKLGYSPSTYNLGVCYEQGRGGVTRDVTKAIELFKSASAGGHKMASAKLEKI